MSLSPNLTIKDVFLKACKEGNPELARVLLANGADVNWMDGVHFHYAGLHYAANVGHEELLDLLLAQRGVDVNTKDSLNGTPLMVACVWGEENIVRKLRQVEGIHLNCQSGAGFTALHLAVMYGSPGCVRELKGAAGLDWNIKDVDGMTPLLVAAYYGRADCLQVLLNVPHVDLAATNKSGYNVAWVAVMSLEDELNDDDAGDQLRCVKLLSEEPSVDWNTRDEAGDTPLLFCLKEKKLDLLRILLNNPSVDSNGQDKDGKYPETIARYILVHISSVNSF